MKTTSQNDAQSSENKTLVNIFAVVSLLILATIVIKTTNFSALSSNPFGNNPEVASSLIGTKNNAAPTSLSTVVADALAFKALLTTTQQATLQKTYTTTLARKWSNLPCGSGCRNGVQFSTLTTPQLAAAMTVIADATGTGANTGYDQFTQILKADAYLGANGGGSGYSAGIYFIAFLNTPSATGAWMLQFGGHHYAMNIAFNNGQVVGVTPQMIGVEPTSFVTSSVTYTPLTIEHNAHTAMLASLTTAQLATAKLTSTFSDCLMSPGESNGNTNTMPATKQGLICSGLTTTQKDLVIAAIKNCTNDADSATAATLLALYTSEINSTYIAWTGTGTSGSASTFLSTNTNYVRIDGPSVWIEFICQTGVVFSSQIHYHSVWRDHVRDYGADLSLTALATNSFSKPAAKLTLYPNPATGVLNIALGTTVSDANIFINDMTGRTILKKNSVSGSLIEIDLSSIPNGNYVIKVENEGKTTSSKFIKN